MKKYRKAAALILGAVLTVTWGGSSLKAEEWSDGSEETVIWQEPETQEEGVFTAPEEEPPAEEKIAEETPADNEIVQPEPGTDAAEESVEQQIDSEKKTEEQPEVEDTAEIREGTCNAEGTVTWTLDAEGNMFIEGEGAMDDWETEETVPWNELRSEIRTVTIAEGVTNVGSYAFAGCQSLEEIQLPESIQQVGTCAFYQIAGPDTLTIG